MAQTPDHQPPPSDSSQPSPLRELLTLAAPTVVQMASYTLMQFIDTWMLHFLGENAPTAAANSGMMVFSVLGFGMGVMWIVNTIASQHFGAGRFRRCGQTLWQGLWFGIAYSAIVTVAAMPLARPMFKAFGHEPQQITLEAVYFRIALAGAVIKMVSTAFGQFLLAIDRPGSVLISAVSGVAVNILAAWILVLGHGVHSLGVAGAALAQNIGVACELLVLIALATAPALRTQFGVLDWRLRRDQIKTFLRIGLPSGLQFLGDILPWSVFCNAVIGILGAKAMAANTFTMRYMVVSFMPAIGVSVAVTALVGRYIGMQRPELAVARTRLAFFVVASYMVGCGCLFFIGRRFLLLAFTNDPQTLAIGAIYMTYSAVYQFFDALYIVYNGALRGAGDTFVPAMATAVFCWVILVAGALLVAKFAPWAGYGGPWFVATIYGISLGIWIYGRFRAGRWRTIRLEPSPRDLSGNVKCQM